MPADECAAVRQILTSSASGLSLTLFWQRCARVISMDYSLLDPEFVVRMDRAHVARGAHLEIRTAEDWARLAMTAFSRYAPFVQPALINGSLGVVLALGGKLSQVVSFTISNGKITQIDIITNRDRLKQLDLSLLDE